MKTILGVDVVVAAVGVEAPANHLGSLRHRTMPLPVQEPHGLGLCRALRLSGLHFEAR